MIPIVANLTITAAMFGVIWIVQLVHYPMLNGLDEKSFAKWHEFHAQKITFVVGPLMVGELGLSGWLAWVRMGVFGLSTFALTVAIWIATFALSVPIHNRLGSASLRTRSQTESEVDRLVFTNWVRTALYSLKLALLIGLFLTS